MEKVLAYGLGRYFEKNYDEINKRYNIVAYSDKNLDKLERFKSKMNVVDREYLKKYKDDFDKILITVANPLDVLKDLEENLMIPNDKISIAVAEKYSMEHGFSQCSQNGEDLLLLLLAKLFWEDLSEVRYLEIGTCHPVFHNNSYMLYQHGMRGWLIDPLLENKYLCKLFRPDDNFIQAAITGSPREKDVIKFYKCCNSLGISSMSLDWVRSFKGENVIEEIEAKVLDIGKLLTCVPCSPEILLVDAEGEDENILKSIDYAIYQPDIIMAELGKADIIKSFMEMKGYTKLFDNNVNTIFVSRKKKDKLNAYIGV